MIQRVQSTFFRHVLLSLYAFRHLFSFGRSQSDLYSPSSKCNCDKNISSCAYSSRQLILMAKLGATGIGREAHRLIGDVVLAFFTKTGHINCYRRQSKNTYSGGCCGADLRCKFANCKFANLQIVKKHGRSAAPCFICKFANLRCKFANLRRTYNSMNCKFANLQFVNCNFANLRCKFANLQFSRTYDLGNPELVLGDSQLDFHEAGCS